MSAENHMTGKAAILVVGRLNPGVSPAVGALIRRYSEISPNTQVIAYIDGFRGLLEGRSINIGEKERNAVKYLLRRGGAPIGSSRARLDNKSHLVNTGLLQSTHQNPIEICAKQLKNDEVSVVHIIGSKSVCGNMHDVVKYANEKLGHRCVIIGMPKTTENDMFPVAQTLGSQTVATQSAEYFCNVVAEHNANPRMLIVHEIKGRAGGWLATATASEYKKLLDQGEFATGLGLERESYDVHAVYTPDMQIDLQAECVRLNRIMNRHDNVNVFVAQGCFAKEIEAEAAAGAKLPKHPTLGYTQTQPGQWLGKYLKAALKADKVLVQKSGVFVRAAAPSKEEVGLALSLASSAVTYAFKAVNGGNFAGDLKYGGVVGHDMTANGKLHLIPVNRLQFDDEAGFKWSGTPWAVEVFNAIGQPVPAQPVMQSKL